MSSFVVVIVVPVLLLLTLMLLLLKSRLRLRLTGRKTTGVVTCFDAFVVEWSRSQERRPLLLLLLLSSCRKAINNFGFFFVAFSYFTSQPTNNILKPVTKIFNNFFRINCTLSLVRFLRGGVNFTIILRAAFTRADPKSTKKTVKSSSFLRLWDLFA